MQLSSLILIIIILLTAFTCLRRANSRLGIRDACIIIFALSALALSHFSVKLIPELVLNAGSLAMLLATLVTMLSKVGASFKCVALTVLLSAAIVGLSRLPFPVEPGIVFALVGASGAFFQKSERAMFIACGAPYLSYLLACALELLTASTSYVSMSAQAVLDAQTAGLCGAYLISLLKLYSKDIKGTDKHILPYNEEDELYGVPKGHKEHP